jgi:hypothetical protein
MELYQRTDQCSDEAQARRKQHANAHGYPESLHFKGGV